jgi:hypothetical protein
MMLVCRRRPGDGLAPPDACGQPGLRTAMDGWAFGSVGTGSAGWAGLVDVGEPRRYLSGWWIIRVMLVV